MIYAKYSLKISAVILLCYGAFSVKLASAEVITHNVSLPASVLFSDTNSGDKSWILNREFQSYQLPQFDATLGKLSSFVTSYSINVTNIRIGIENLFANYSPDILIANPPSISNQIFRVGVSQLDLLSQKLPSYAYSASLAQGDSIKVKHNYDGILDYSGLSGTIVSHTLNKTVAALDVDYSNPAALAEVSGKGKFNLSSQATFWVSTSGGYSGGASYFTEYMYTSAASVTYNFDRIGTEVNLILNGTQVRDSNPSYISESGTRAVLLDSAPLSAPTTVHMQYLTTPGDSTVNGVNGLLKTTSDILEISGLNGIQFVLQLSYNEGLATAGGRDEKDVFLGWYNPSTDNWENAVFGNSVASTHSAYLGSYDEYLASHGGAATLGMFGVDISNNTVWAVLDHNSQFGAVTAVPEPGSGAMLLLGLGLLTGVVSRRNV